MNELILRAIKGRASDQEGMALRRWRQASPDHERQYREVVDFLMEGEEAAWEMVADSAPPPVEAILAVAREPRGDTVSPAASSNPRRRRGLLRRR